MDNLSLLVFLDLNYTYESELCNGCHDRSMMAYEIENIAILNVRGVDHRCSIWNMTRNDANNMLNNSKLNEKRWLWMWTFDASITPVEVINMNFDTIKTSIEVIKERTFGGTYFRDIYYGINGKWYKKLRKEFDELKNIAKEYYCSTYREVNVHKYKVKCRTY